MTLQEQLRVLDELIDSPAWNLLKDQMNKDILMAAYQLSDNAPVTVDELHFKRGAIWAGRRMIDMPEQMKTMINNELIMQMAQADYNKTDH